MSHTVSLYIFRHGQTDYNLQHRFQGHLDTPLNSTGKEQARELIPIFEDIGPEAIFCSDLKRAKETAEIVFEDFDITYSEMLREIDLGDYAGKPKSELAQIDVLEKWLDRRDDSFMFPNGESNACHRKRITTYINEIVSINGFKKIAISTHGGSLARIIDNCFNGNERDRKICNCDVIRVDIHEDGRWEFKGFLTQK